MALWEEFELDLPHLIIFDYPIPEKQTKNWDGLQILKLFEKVFPKSKSILAEDLEETCFEDVILMGPGMTIAKSYYDWNYRHYTFDLMRDRVYSSLGLEKDNFGQNVCYVSGKTKILNAEKIESTLRLRFPDRKFVNLDFRNMSIVKQIESTTRCGIYYGVTSEENLSNFVWLGMNATFIEVIAEGVGVSLHNYQWGGLIGYGIYNRVLCESVTEYELTCSQESIQNMVKKILDKFEKDGAKRKLIKKFT